MLFSLKEYIGIEKILEFINQMFKKEYNTCNKRESKLYLLLVYLLNSTEQTVIFRHLFPVGIAWGPRSSGC